MWTFVYCVNGHMHFTAEAETGWENEDFDKTKAEVLSQCKQFGIAVHTIDLVETYENE